MWRQSGIFNQRLHSSIATGLALVIIRRCSNLIRYYVLYIAVNGNNITVSDQSGLHRTCSAFASPWNQGTL